MEEVQKKVLVKKYDLNLTEQALTDRVNGAVASGYEIVSAETYSKQAGDPYLVVVYRLKD